VANPKLVMPAIYMFDFPEYPQQSKWGWHNAREVEEAVKNILSSTEIPLKTIKGLYRQQPLVQVQAGFREPLREFSVASANGELWQLIVQTSDEWFTRVVEKNYFIPARIGTRLIRAIKMR